MTFLENVKLVTIYKCCLCQKNTCQIKKLQEVILYWNWPFGNWKVSVLQSVRLTACPSYSLSVLQPVRLIEFFCFKGIGILPGNCQVSVLDRCPSYGMSVLRRFHCISTSPYKVRADGIIKERTERFKIWSERCEYLTGNRTSGLSGCLPKDLIIFSLLWLHLLPKRIWIFENPYQQLNDLLWPCVS